MNFRASIALALVLMTPACLLAQTAQADSGTTPATTQSTAPAPAPPKDSSAAPTANDAAAPATAPSLTTDSATAATAPKEKHDGGKDDVSDIGNRKVGKGGKLGNWYSLEKEIAMGKQYAAQVEQTAKMVQDPVVTEYVNRIGQNLVRNSDARVPFTIKVVDSDEVNAFALPGGFFYVNSGLILAADEEAELAGVMAHEIAHVAARHGTRQMTRFNWANLATIPLIFVGGGIGYAAQGIVSIGLPMAFMKFSRGFEAEADYLGLQYMYAAGYDPQAFIAFFEKIQAKEKKKPGTLAKAFASHPQTPERISASQKEINNVLPPRPQYIVTTSEFDEVKARLAALENRHKIVDDQKSRPTLRRTSASDKKPDDTNSDKQDKPDDDRPTLKRRD
jgi:predicted Zn-dependent protease